MAYTYDDFMARLNESGLQSQFSQWDMDTARQYPEFGISLISLKQDYNNATTDQARAMANEMANQLRASYGNYSGGRYGDQYISLGRTPGGYQSRYGSQIDDMMNSLTNYGDFSFDVQRPTYESRYDEQMQGLLDEIVNRQPYLYNLETDPVWSAYKKQYTREGQRATADTLAQVSAMTGGMPSSYAATAAQQAGDYYATQMADMIPQLYQQAYDRYLAEYQMKQQDLSAVQSMEQMDYGKYIDSLGQWNTDRNFAYNQWQDGYNMLYNNLGAMQGQDDREYGRYMDDLNWGAQQNAARQEQAALAQTDAQAQVDAIIAAGGRPSAELIAASGYPQEYIDAMVAYYAQQNAGYGGGGYGGSSGGTQGKPFTAEQYELFKNEMAVAKDNSARLNLLEDAVTKGRITEAQARELARLYGIQLY